MNPTSVEGSSNLLRKQVCIIHCSDGDSDLNLVSPQNLDSWKTLRRAAEIRQHLRTLDLAKDLCEGEIPPVQYHRRCRSLYHSKKCICLWSSRRKFKKTIWRRTKQISSVWWEVYHLRKIKQVYEGPKYEGTSHTMFRVARRGLDQKSSSHQTGPEDACYH